MTQQAANLQLALDWLENIVAGCLKTRFGEVESYEVSPLNLYSDDSWLAAFMDQRDPAYEEFAVLMLAIAPHLSPHLLGKIISEHLPEGGDFPEFGGAKSGNHRGILPTGETAQFILAGDDLEKRLAVQYILSNDHWLTKEHTVWLGAVREGEPLVSGRVL